MAAAPTPAAPPDKRRLILDAAVVVFARRGFTQCRVADIADEAGVAYGLVYHYFKSKDAVLDTLFLERWDLMREVIGQIDARPVPASEKLRAVAGFIVDSYRHDPELMQVIVVEVTRAANSFGRTHWEDIRRAYDAIAAIVASGIASGELRDAVPPDFSAMAFYGVMEQLLTQWIFAEGPIEPAEFDRAPDLVVETICGGLAPRR